MRKKLVYLIYIIPPLIWVLLIFLAPYLEYSGRDLWSGLIYHIYAATCHQLPERSFFFMGFKLAVCARCTGIYAGFLVTSLIYPLIKDIDNRKIGGKKLLILSMIPMGLDGGLQLLTGYESNNTLRLATGLFFGFILPFYVIPIYNEIMYGIIGKEDPVKKRNEQ